MTPEAKRDALVKEMGVSSDEAAHMLADMGEIDSTDHADLLSEGEYHRIWDDRRKTERREQIRRATDHIGRGTNVEG